jgi:hypothetical protein
LLGRGLSALLGVSDEGDRGAISGEGRLEEPPPLAEELGVAAAEGFFASASAFILSCHVDESSL